MRLQNRHLIRRQLSIRKRAAQHALLRLPIWRGQAGAASVLTNCAPKQADRCFVLAKRHATVSIASERA